MPKVIVAGGGIAGLMAAYTLQKDGFDVEVLERETMAGGRMRSERHGDFVVDRGAQFIASTYKNMHELVDELGLKPQVRRLKTGRGATLRNGRFVSGNYAGYKAIFRARDLSWSSKMRLPRIIFELRRNKDLLDFYAIEKAAPLDDCERLRLGARRASAARCWTRLSSHRSPRPSRSCLRISRARSCSRRSTTCSGASASARFTAATAC